jgi:hypothetical protein
MRFPFPLQIADALIAAEARLQPDPSEEEMRKRGFVLVRRRYPRRRDFWRCLPKKAA